MLKQGRVIKFDRNNPKYFYIILNLSGGSCKDCQACSHGKEASCNEVLYGPFINKEDIPIKFMDLVEVEIYPSTHLIPALVIFVIPVIAIIIFTYLHIYLDDQLYFYSILGVFIILYLFLIYKLNKMWKTRVKGALSEKIDSFNFQSIKTFRKGIG